MKRSVVFSDPQAKWLEKVAKEMGISIGELVRRIIDEAREKKRG